MSREAINRWPAREFFIAALMALLAAGCGTRTELEDPRLALPEAERARATAFIEEIRRLYEIGDGPSVAALIHAKDMPDFFQQYTRVRFVPKGPTKITSVRLEPLLFEGDSIDVGGVAYGFNIDPLGQLVLEVEDVSVGPMEVRMTIGTHAGEYYIAGWKALD